MTEPSDLPLLERARRFRELAAEAARDAARTKGAVRESYLILHNGWLQLAEDIEAAVKRDQEWSAFEQATAYRPLSNPED